MSKKNIPKTIAILLSPLLLFPLLAIPYAWLNSHVLVDWLGCGCERVDEFGNIVKNSFNANIFTEYFWIFISLCVMAIAIFLSRKIPPHRVPVRMAYVIALLFLSLWISQGLCRLMMWD
ncbi:MAG: hypothetical protein IJY39_06175 [Clostridia bacterium]|nr:hypothetical protein [Clostridia bacterium]